MQDVAYLLLLLAVFAVLGLFVVACDRIIGPDEEALAESAPPTPAHPLAERTPGREAA
jgi:hypothetical protein